MCSLESACIAEENVQATFLEVNTKCLRLHATVARCAGIFPVALTRPVAIAGILYVFFSTLVIFHCPADKFSESTSCLYKHGQHIPVPPRPQLGLANSILQRKLAMMRYYIFHLQQQCMCAVCPFNKESVQHGE